MHKTHSGSENLRLVQEALHEVPESAEDPRHIHHVALAHKLFIVRCVYVTPYERMYVLYMYVCACIGQPTIYVCFNWCMYVFMLLLIRIYRSTGSIRSEKLDGLDAIR